MKIINLQFVISAALAGCYEKEIVVVISMVLVKQLKVIHIPWSLLRLGGISFNAVNC